jgi:hypothetical protein
MSLLINALNFFTSNQRGENNCGEYGWSNDIEEEITQIFFQLTRTSSIEQMNSLRDRYITLIQRSSKDQRKYYQILCKIAVQTRDIEDGKGEYRLAWYLINAFDKAGETNTAMNLVYYCVHELPLDNSEFNKTSIHPFGSWKDIKYLWSQFEWSNEMSTYMIKLINEQLQEDYLNLDKKKPISLVGRWVPRESSQFKKMFRYLALDYFSHYLETANTDESRNSAKKKAYKDYRRVITKLNNSLATVQVNQCAGKWSDIDYDNDVTSITMTRQSLAFRNKTKQGLVRSNNPDRIEAAAKFDIWLANKVSFNTTIKGSRVGINELVARALKFKHMIGIKDESMKNQLNLQWADGSKKIGNLGNMIAMIDTSGSMAGDPINAAIGLGLRVANHSKLGRRVMTFSATPKWIQLVDKSENEIVDFVSDTVMIARDSSWGMNTNFTAALKMILEAAVSANLKDNEVSEFTLVIFSDMQIDYPGNESLSDSMWDHITELYNNAGYSKVPHILFWNLRSTSGFPVLNKQKGASMLSGFSPALLNAFCDKGIDFLNDCSPWNMMNSILDNPRYNIFNN